MVIGKLKLLTAIVLAVGLFSSGLYVTLSTARSMAALAPQAKEIPQPPTPSVSSSKEQLDELLNAWEKKMAGVDSLVTDVTRTEVDALTKKETIYVGQIALLKPDLLRIDLTRKDEVAKKDAEKSALERLYIDSDHIYEFVPNDKLILVHDRIPKEKQAVDAKIPYGRIFRAFARLPEALFEHNLVLVLLRGVKANDLEKRFDLQLQRATEWYAYLMILPKTDDDKQDFAAAQITFWLKNPNPEGQPDLTMTPVRIWHRSPNGREMTYVFKDMQLNAKLKRVDFAPGEIEGFRRKSVPPYFPPKRSDP